jgi:hypothetical protein
MIHREGVAVFLFSLSFFFSVNGKLGFSMVSVKDGGEV